MDIFLPRDHRASSSVTVVAPGRSSLLCRVPGPFEQTELLRTRPANVVVRALRAGAPQDKCVLSAV